MPSRTYHQRNVPIDGYAPRDHPLYSAWSSMLQRCTNPNNPGFVNYGARGIKVSRRWYHFENFVADMGERPEEDFTIERVDNSKGYMPGNCTWSTRSRQSYNRRKFKNNTSGFTGVVEIHGRYEARLDFEHVRYRIGRFDTARQAADARASFERLFFKDRESAVASVRSETTWSTSSTRVRGVTVHPDGGYIARATLNGVRHYIGYFATIEEASDARKRFIEG